ncbi:MAG: sarcosine oxidase subunit gamma [Pseudomonadota bacterium]
MVDRVSALAGHYNVGHHGAPASDNTGVTLQDMTGLVLHQIAAWPDTIGEVGNMAATAAGTDAAPGPRASATGSNGTLLRIEPLKWWLFGTEALEVDPEKGNTLDVSHSRTHIRVAGPDAANFLNRHFPIDFREDSFPVGSVTSSVTHHVACAIWRSDNGYEVFLPRGFALTLWEGFVESAEQFGLEII